MKHFNSLLLVCCLLITRFSFAQSTIEAQIKCTIIDSSSNSPLVGASLYMLDKSTHEVIAGTMSDSKGFCSLKVSTSPNMSAAYKLPKADTQTMLAKELQFC